ncbi:hypothetical protein [Reichenbachiella sp.]|uniref:hypothetical protein n=1 Tax=Reichenbachiella sp. TaxID=2184521 RepID=UPI003BAE6C10
MKYFSIFILLLFSRLGFAQTTNLGASTTLNVKGTATFYIGGGATFNGLIDNEGNILVEEDAYVVGTVSNRGTLVVRGDAHFDPISVTNNDVESTLGIRGNTLVDGVVGNNGDLFITGGETSVVNGSIDNNGTFNVESNLQLSGMLDNTSGQFGMLGNLVVDGTLINPDGAESAIDGDVNLNTPFSNGGKISATGTAIINDEFVNTNEALFGGETYFENTAVNEDTIAFASNVTFNGALTNNGIIFSVEDGELNFVNNKHLGDLSFIDVEDRATINEVILVSSADSIFINELNLNTIGTVTLPPNFVLVQSGLNIEKGVLNATNQETFLVQGQVNVNSDNETSTPSYVEGQMLAVTNDTVATVFPMGINGSPNYVAINSSTPGVTVKVECKQPDPDSLITDENTMGLAQEVEWVIQALGDSAEINVSVSYSGVDFTSTPNFINAREYDATLQRFAQGDSVFTALQTTGSVNDNIGTTIPEAGTIRTADKIWITSKPTRFALGISPVLTEPEVYLPNVFSPGALLSDNTIFRPFVGGAIVNSITFLIFDSFNREVYTATLTGEDLKLDDLGWDGNLKSGQEAPEGVYYYNVSISYDISNEVSDKYFSNGERNQTQEFSKLGSVLLVK